MDELLITAEPELLVTTDVLAESVTLVETELLTETVQELVEVEVPPELLLEQSEALEVLDLSEAAEVIELAMQGPPGPPGLDGSSASAPYVTFPAAGPIGGNRAVRLTAGLASYADASMLPDANLVLGISRAAAVNGAPVQIQTGGLMTEPSWAWTADQPVFCGANGTLTQSAPVAGFDLILGIALSATQIHIGARMPIALA